MAHTTLTSLFSDIADAIRAKTGGSAQLVADDFPTAIAAIPSCTVATASATAGGSRSISFSGLAARPKLWAVIATGDVNNTQSYYYATSAVWDGNSVRALALARPGTNTAMIGDKYESNWTQSFNNGTLTVTMGSTSYHQFKSGITYDLVYVY